MNHPTLIAPSSEASEAWTALAASLSERLAVSQVIRVNADWSHLFDSVVTELATKAAEHISTALSTYAQEVSARLAADLADLPGIRIALAGVADAIAQHATVIDAFSNSSHRSILYQLATEHHGFVTTSMAELAGVPAVEVRKVAARGGMSNLARGLYRVEGIEGGERAPYAEAVLRVGEDAHLIGDSVLAFHDLALVNPRRITVGTPRRVRRDLPAHIKLVHTRTDSADLTEYDGVPSLTVERALKDSIGSVMPERLAEAVERAAEEGLVRRRAAHALLAEIGSAA